MHQENVITWKKPRTMMVTMRSLLTIQSYLFILSITSFTLAVFFGIYGNIASFYGMVFVFVLVTLLISPNFIDYLKMPGFEIKRYVKEARDLSNEIKEFARGIAFLSVRLAFRSTGWLTFGKEAAELQDEFIDNAQKMLAMIGSDINSEHEISDFYYYHTLQEYKLYIVQHSTQLNSNTNRAGRKYGRITDHHSYPNAETTPTADEIKSTLVDCNELNADAMTYVEAYDYFYKHRKHKSSSIYRERHKLLPASKN